MEQTQKQHKSKAKTNNKTQANTHKQHRTNKITQKHNKHKQ